MRLHPSTIALFTLAALPPAAAHHSRANFLNETIVLDGEVVRFAWANPHALLYLKVTDAAGKTTQWEVETNATPTLARSGWTEGSLRTGDHVTVRAQPDRNRQRAFASLQSVLKQDGTVLAVTPPDTPADASRPRATSVFGTWQPARRRQGGAGIAPGAADEPPLSLPLTAKGLEAAHEFDSATNPRNQCMAFATPEILGNPYLHAIERAGDNVVLRNEYMEVDRVVYMDGRAPPPGERTLQGHSVGRWEGEGLVVETTSFADHPWGTARGIPSGARKRVVESYRLTDDGETLTVDFTIEDPDYLSEPFSGQEQWRFAPRLTLVPNKCDVSVARRYLGVD